MDRGGPREINQVFFNDVEVLLDDRVGEEHDGWKVAKYLLSLERFGTAEVSRSMRSLQRLRACIESRHNQDVSSRHLDRLCDLEIDLRALELTELRLLFAGAEPGAEASLLKLRGTEIQNGILELLHDVAGEYATLAPDQSDAVSAAPAAASYAGRAHFNYRKTMIYAGSNEIQRNIIAKAVLGLPQ